MTEPTVPPALPSKKKRSLFLPIALAIIVVAVAGFVASRAGLDKALVKQQLDRFAADLKEKGQAQGRDLELSYGELEVVGSFGNKHVVIHNPSLRVQPLERKVHAENNKIDALVVSTPTMAIYPQSVDLSALRIEAAEPINFSGLDTPDRSLLSIKSDVPLVVSISSRKNGEVDYHQIDYQSPTQMLLTYLREEQAAGEEEATPTIVPVYQTMQVDFAKDSGFSSSAAADDSGLGEAKLSLRDVVITPQAAPEGAMKLAEISASWNNSLNEKKLNAIHATVAVGPITSDNPEAPYLPMALHVDATYEGMMNKSPQSIAQAQAQESSMELKTFEMTTKDSSLKATASFTANTADVLPVGRANIALTNAPFVLGELHKFGILNEENEPLVTSVLQQITGTPLSELKDLSIALERARGGSFKVGNTTFEELVALFLKQALQPKMEGTPAASVTQPQQGLAPQLPSVDKPKSAPISVPDHGVRG